MVCEAIEITRTSSLETILGVLRTQGHIRETVNTSNEPVIECTHFGFGDDKLWKLPRSQVEYYFKKPARLGGGGEAATSDKFLEHFGRSFVAPLFLDRRLTATNETSSFDHATSRPSNEMQALYDNKEAKRRLGEEIREVFGKSIWIDNSRGNLLCLRVSDSPDPPTPADRLEPSVMRTFRQIEDEGDGFRSYVATCIALLLGQQPVILLDEPEMCLHPPQAYMLGRFIGRHGTSSESTIFVATHSSHILRGVIEEAASVEVIRLQRVNERFGGHRVSHDLLQASIKKPSTRAENVLDGLFADAVTIVESEGDRSVYGAAWKKVAKGYRHDVHFVSAGGLGGMADPFGLYKELKIPVVAAVDLDVMRASGTFQAILRAAATPSEAADLIKLFKQIIGTVKALGPVTDESETQEELQRLLDEGFDWNDERRLAEVRNRLATLASGLSLTSRLKKGLSAFEHYGVYSDLNAFLSRCREVGVFLVPAGELEDWLHHVASEAPSRNNKSEWASFAVNRIRESAPQDGDVWEFVRQMGNFQRDASSRLAGYPIRLGSTG